MYIFYLLQKLHYWFKLSQNPEKLKVLINIFLYTFNIRFIQLRHNHKLLKIVYSSVLVYAVSIYRKSFKIFKKIPECCLFDQKVLEDELTIKYSL